MTIMAPMDRRGALDPLDALNLDALLTAPELALRRRVRAFVEEDFEPQIAGLFEQGHWPRELAPALGRLGVLGMHLNGYGCAGSSAVEYGLACLELEAGDTGLRTFVSVQGSLVMTAIHAWGSEEQKQQWLPALAAGEAIGCFGLTEPDAGSDPSSMRTRAHRVGSDWVLNGTKRWIGMGSIADIAVVWAATKDGIRGFLLPAGTPGFSTRDIVGKLSMRASLQSELSFQDCRLPADALLPDARGLRAPFTSLNEARYGIVWGVVGAARSCYECALHYSTQRVQFGRPIAGFQLTQQTLVEMMLAVNKGTLLALHLGRMLDDRRAVPEHISIGKLDNTRMALEVARRARAVLGGNGITLDYPVMRHMVNLESPLTYEGTAEIHTLILGNALTGLRAYS